MSMDALLKGFVENGKAAGLSALVYKRGSEAYFGALGDADRENGKQFARDTIVRIYSMSKIVTAVTAMVCVEKGLLDLDDPVEKYIPEFAQAKKAVADDAGHVSFVPAENKMTIRHLLTMTSGVTYGGDGEKPEVHAVAMAYGQALKTLMARRKQGETVTTLDFVRSIAACPLQFEPGTQWLYSLSIDVVGGVIEVVTGKTLYEAMKEFVLGPLQMNETFFNVPEDKKHRVATIYARDSQGNMIPYDAGDMFGIEMGGGGLFSTVDDMMRFARMLMNGGELDGVRILKPETLSEMTRAQFDPRTMPGFNWADEVGYGYGLGVRVMLRPEESVFDECVGAFGWNGMAGTTLRVSPEEGQVLVFFIQNIPSNSSYFLPLVAKEARAL